LEMMEQVKRISTSKVKACERIGFGSTLIEKILGKS
jgi:hypothetical protein